MKEMIKNTVQHMVKRSRMTFSQVSSEMGKYPSFLATSLYKGSIPRLDTFLKIAEITGYKVVLIGNNEEITMVVPDSEDSVTTISSDQL